MKSLATITFLFVYLISFGQSGNSWKINQLDFKIQPLIIQNFKDLSYQDIQHSAKDPSKVSVDMSAYELSNNFGYESDVFSFHLSANKKISEGWYHEVGIGLGLYDLGEFLVEYQNPKSLQTSGSLGWCRLQDRYEFNVSYFRKYMDKVFSIKIGPVLSYSRSFYDEILLLDYSESSFDPIITEEGNHSSYLLGSIEIQLGVNVYRGIQPFIGYIVGYGGQLDTPNRITSNNYSFGLSYQFGR